MPASNTFNLGYTNTREYFVDTWYAADH